ncbi:autoinducer response regulator [Izhakiella australiensis]|uniref:Autoinducer response regulator n=1 Tax=Izhakiella australiensis TaxID=1926881 RepID=A0A1S8YD77_9GAMM|nr:autoinducer response regulator [Izhakiella australiensis]
MADNFFKNEEINKNIKNFLEKELLETQYLRFGYFIINKKNLNDISIINNHPEWFKLYTKFNHQMVDPVVIKSLTRVEDFSWDEEIVILSKLALPRVMLHAKKYDINSGHTFILHDHKNNLVLLSVFDASGYQKEITADKDREKMSLLLIRAHQKMLNLYNTFEGDVKTSISITSKENRVLYWASKGKTYKEIALIVGVQERTVKFHMGNIVRKLEAVNAKHAIRLASELKLVRVPDCL